MGEDGKGSLEPGVASGDVFVMAYPTPFCEYYWYANRAELDDEKRKKLFPDAEQGGASTGVAADGAALAEGGAKEAVVKKEEQSKPPIFDHLTLASSTLNIAGPQRGSYTNKYTCNVVGLLHFWDNHHTGQKVRNLTSHDGATFVQHRSLVGLRYKRND